MEHCVYRHRGLLGTVVPLLVMAYANDPVERIFDACRLAAYSSYGADDYSTIRSDKNKYREEESKCLSDFTRDLVSFQKIPGDGQARHSGLQTKNPPADKAGGGFILVINQLSFSSRYHPSPHGSAS